LRWRKAPLAKHFSSSWIVQKNILQTIAVQIRNRRKQVAFNTHGVAKKPPWQQASEFLLYQPFHQFDRLHGPISAGIAVAE